MMTTSVVATATGTTTRSQKNLSTAVNTRTVPNMAQQESGLTSPPRNPQLQGLQESLNSVLSIVKKNGENMETITHDIHLIKQDITGMKEVTNEAEGVKEQLHSTQGKLDRMELKNAKLEEKVLSLESQLYQKDLVFYNVEDSLTESDQDLKQTLYHVMQQTMKVPGHLLFNRNNPCGEVRLDTVTRMGRYKLNNKRPVIATFVTRTGRNVINSRTFTANLKNPDTRIRIAEHFPTITKERRHVQIKNHLTQLRETHKDNTNRITINKDKILLNGVENETFAFKRNPLPSISPLSIKFNKLAHSDEVTEKKSTFQAHALHVETITQAIAAKNSIYQNSELAQATHIIYAYKISIDEETTESGYCDDDEVGGGKILMDLLKNKSNMFICVTRKKKGPNIGEARFTHIKTCATNLLQREDIPNEPTFNNIIFN